MKRFSIVLALTMALCLAFVGAAYANFGPHGGYVNDTDSCAGCHRAHTSFSTVGWKDSLGTQHQSALLVGNATSMSEFCYACHGDQAPGASTNVVSGIFDSGPSSGVVGTVTAHNQPLVSTDYTNKTGTQSTTYPGDSAAGIVQYTTASTFGAPLNGGGFTRMPDPYAWQGFGVLGSTTTAGSSSVVFVASTSQHNMEANGPLWGSGNTGGVSTYVKLTCTDCHDPHGTSNYRLLKAAPNAGSSTTIVGGYTGPTSEVPNAFVFSNETGYPIPKAVFDAASGGGGQVSPSTNVQGGWLKHEAGATQMASYVPNYTNTTGTSILHTEKDPQTKSMSVWCASCHQEYNQRSAGDTVTYNYNPWLPINMSGAPNATLGTQSYHRHAVDMPANSGNLFLTEPVTVGDGAWIPLENPGAGGAHTDYTDGYVGCLTCHRAHGGSATMSGWSNAHLELQGATTIYLPVKDSVAGVDPDKGSSTTGAQTGTSALLRANNRGVCERCHNK